MANVLNCPRQQGPKVLQCEASYRARHIYYQHFRAGEKAANSENLGGSSSHLERSLQAAIPSWRIHIKLDELGESRRGQTDDTSLGVIIMGTWLCDLSPPLVELAVFSWPQSGAGGTVWR